MRNSFVPVLLLPSIKLNLDMPSGVELFQSQNFLIYKIWTIFPREVKGNFGRHQRGKKPDKDATRVAVVFLFFFMCASAFLQCTMWSSLLHVFLLIDRYRLCIKRTTEILKAQSARHADSFDCKQLTAHGLMHRLFRWLRPPIPSQSVQEPVDSAVRVGSACLLSLRVVHRFLDEGSSSMDLSAFRRRPSPPPSMGADPRSAALLKAPIRGSRAMKASRILGAAMIVLPALVLLYTVFRDNKPSDRASLFADARGLEKTDAQNVEFSASESAQDTYLANPGWTSYFVLCEIPQLSWSASRKYPSWLMLTAYIGIK